MENKKIQSLLYKYNAGECSEEEKALLETWYLFQKTDSSLDLSDDEIETDLQEVFKALPKYQQKRASKIRSRIAAAAAVLIVMSVSFYFYFSATESVTSALLTSNLPLKTDIAPGGNRATLTLADGSVISLDDVSNGEVVEQEGMKVTKTADGLLTYTIIPSGKASQNSTFNTISTPKGGQYQVILADGTKVWLNAASSLRFPTVFTGNKRLVELSGEGYFEVSTIEEAPNRMKTPFVVKTLDQEVKVLGTHFNINSYADELATVTTLLEGSVEVSQLSTANSQLLKPGEQSSLSIKQGIRITAVDVTTAVAWKNGLFQFQGSDIKSVMRQFSRWYDVEVEFEGSVPDIKLWGEVYRNVHATQALEILEYFNLKYEIVQTDKGKKVVIS